MRALTHARTDVSWYSRACQAHPSLLCGGAGLTAPTSPLRLGSPPPHLHQYWACPHLHREWAHPCHICTGTAHILATSAPRLGSLGSPQVHGNVLDASPRVLLHGRWREAGQRRTLLDHRTRGRRFAPPVTWPAPRCLLRVVCCLLSAARCTLHVVCRTDPTGPPDAWMTVRAGLRAQRPFCLRAFGPERAPVWWGPAVGNSGQGICRNGAWSMSPAHAQ